jgi:PAS domain S-box-containing protein
MMSRRDRTFLAGGGEMGALMRRHDWGATPLGEPDLWPQSLRTSVSTCLNCAFPILLWWGRELVMLYNDEYMPIIGAKHPAALGQAGAECWPEIWDLVGPMLSQVLQTGQPTRSRDMLLSLQRKGFAEECYFSFSYSPIRDETGGVGGVFTPVMETSAKVIGERRLRTLRDLAAQAATTLDVDTSLSLAAAVLAANPYDIAFAVLYILRGDRQCAERKAYVGVQPSTLFPEVFSLGPSTPERGEVSWSAQAARALANEPTLINGLRGILTPGDLLANPWPEAPDQAVVLPIVFSGEERPSALLVAGISPRLEFDQAYQEFTQLVGRQIGMRLSDAFAYEAERKRAEALAEIDRAKTAFFSNVSHEFRTPLALMLGPLEEALSDRSASELEPLQVQRLEVAHRNGLRLLKLVNTLLEFSRMEAGRIQASFEPVDIGGVTIDLVSSFRSAFDKAGLTLSVECPPLSRPVYLDRDMWEKVVLNLLSNAFKFTFEGGVRVTLAESGGSALLTVADTGVGIPRHELPRVFERFHRIEGQRGRSFEGSGIGLAFVHELVRQHGGSIEVESVVGSGSCFKVSIPFGVAHLPADRLREQAADPSTSRAGAFVDEALRWLPAPAVSVERQAPEAGAGKRALARILLADDNADMRAYLARLLGDAYEVAVVANGEAALQAARERRPDLIISDVMMPVLDGLGLLSALRADASLRDLPVILLSARAGEEARVESLDAGADDYLTKPFSAKELMARVSANLALARLRKEAMQSALDSAERLERLFEQAPAFMCLLQGPSHTFEIANEAYRRLVGGRPLIGRSVREAVPEAEGQGFFEHLDRVYATGVAYKARRAPLRVARGPENQPEERFLDFIYQPMTDKNGEVTGIFVEGVDVTDHVLSEDALRASESRYRTLIEALPQLVWTCTPDGLCDYLSRQWVEFTGMSEASQLGHGWLESTHPVDRQRVAEHWEGAVAGKHPYDIEFRIRRRDGVYRWFKTRGVPVRDGAGAISYWFGTCTDIQEIVEARNVLARTREQLQREIEERTHERDRLWRNSRDLLVVVDREGIFRAANPAWLTLLGWSPEEVVGRLHLDFVHPDDHLGSQGALETATSAPLPVYENRLRHKDGSYRWISWIAAPEDGRVYASGRHVTAEKEAAAELAAAQEALRQAQKMEAIGQLTGGVAHDFNNLLTIIRSSADLLLRPELKEERRRRYIDAISDTVDRAAKLTGQLLAFSRRQALSPRVFDLAEQLTNLMDLLKPILGARISLELDLKVRPAPVEADVNQFETALINLATNARDAMEGAGTLSIRLQSSPAEGLHGGRREGYSVEVTDNGCGIPKSALTHIFEPFFTTKEIGRGTGLGLSQVYGFARQSGGNISVDSQEGGGTTFQLFLPRSDKPLAQTPGAHSEATPRSEARGKILVVEDNSEVGEFSIQLLKDLGYETTYAPNAQAGLALLAEGAHRFDLVFSDVLMPGMNGLEFGQEIRKRWPGLPVVLTSGYSEVLAENGHFGFPLVRKPYSVDELSKTFATALAISAVEAAGR